MLEGFPTRAAWALCTFAYSAGPGTEPILFEGRTDGKIVPARGPSNFGWDPIFEAEHTGLTYVLFHPSSISSVPSTALHCAGRRRYHDPRACVPHVFFLFFIFIYSYAEMEAKQKNAISHRGRALEKLRAYLRQAPPSHLASASA